MYFVAIWKRDPDGIGGNLFIGDGGVGLEEMSGGAGVGDAHGYCGRWDAFGVAMVGCIVWSLGRAVIVCSDGDVICGGMVANVADGGVRHVEWF